MVRDGIINVSLIDMLNVIDARATVCIYENLNSPALYRCSKVYELLSDSEFMNSHKGSIVIGITYFFNGLNILIKEA